MLEKVLDAFPVITLITVVLVVVGAVKSIGGDLTFQEYVDTVWPLAAGTAIGRGLATTRTPR